MNRFNVFITVLVCAGLCVLFGALSRSTEDATGWNPSEMYTSTLSGGSSFTNAAYSGSSNSGVALPMPSASFSSRVGAHASYNGYSASPAAGASSQLPSGGSSAVVGHMTSSAEYHSFGGGGNAAAAGGSSMSRRSSSVNASPISYNALSVGSISLPTTPRSSSVNNGSYTPSLAQEANYAIASSNMQGGLFDYALQTTYGTASYEDYAANYGARQNVRGRQNGGVTDSWLDWLYRYGSGFGEKIGDEENGYTYIFSKDQLLAAYNKYIEDYWDPMWGDENKPTFEQWWAWLTGAGDSGYFYKGNTYTALPIGDMWPLVVFVLLYMLYITIRQRIVNKNANKSLF